MKSILFAVTGLAATVAAQSLTDLAKCGVCSLLSC